MNIIAVSDKIHHAGCILMWSLSGSTNLAALRSAWVAAGLDADELPEAPSPATALRRTVNELKEKHRLVRPLGRGDGFALVRETWQGEEPEYAVEMKAKLDKVGRLVLEPGPAGWDSETANMLREIYHRQELLLSPEDISGWLVDLIPSLDGVAMKHTGGIYFIPFPSLARLGKIVAAMNAGTTHKVYRIPAVHEGDDNSRSDVVRAVLDSIEAEAGAEAAQMEADIAAAKFGARAYENRIARTDEVEQKVARYEALVGSKLEVLRTRLDSLRMNLTIAMSKAQSAEEARGGQALADI